MTAGKIFKNLLTDTSVFFTLYTIMYATVHVIMHIGEDETLVSMRFLIFGFIFSFIAALSMLIYRLTFINKALRIAIQYFLILLGANTCLFIPANITGSHAVIGSFIVTVIYAIILGTCIFFSWAFNKNKGKEEVYERKFKKSK